MSRRVEGDLHRYHLPRARARARAAWPTRWRRCGISLRRPRGDAGLERLPPHGAVLRRVRLGRGAAHPQPAPASRPDGLDRRPRRRPDPVLRPDLPAAGRGGRLARQDDQGLRRDDRPRAHAGRQRHSRPAVLRGPDRRRQRRTSTGPRSTRTPPRRSATPPARPATRRARSTATARRCCTPTRRRCPTRCNCSARDTILPVVPMFHVNAWGLPYVGLHGRRQARVPRALARRQVAARAVRERRRHRLGRRADRLAGPAHARRGQRPELQHHAPHGRSAARPARRR